MSLFCAILLTSWLTICTTNELNLSMLSGRVVGTVVTSCNSPTFHTPPNHPYPTGPLDGQFWKQEPLVLCFDQLSDVLDYCRRVYNKQHPRLYISNVVMDPFKIPSQYLPPFVSSDVPDIKVYLCLGPTNDPTNYPDSPKETTPTPLAIDPTVTGQTAHHLPSLIDVHKAYFAQQFRQLFNSTKMNVSHLVQHLVRETRGLFKLYQSKPDLARYAASHMLQYAHQRLQAIWTEEENKWANLEQAQHEDLVEQLKAEDWISENEFTYVLQEVNPDINRVQDALTRLLARLADSVAEEIRHLKSVETRQPWVFSLESHTDWTRNITAAFTNLETVHQVLLKYVRTATLAINTMRSLMSKHLANHPGQHASIPPYKATLLTSYGRLQTNLFDAQRELNQAKTIVLGNVTNRVHSILGSLNNTVNSTLSAGSMSVNNWVRSKHHSELAFIDLLVAQILGPYASSIGLQPASLSNDIWQPGSGNPLKFITEPSDGRTLKSSLLLSLAVAVIICVGLFLLIGFASLIACIRSQTVGSSPSSRLRTLLSAGGHKLQHLASKQQWMQGVSPTWKVSKHVVVLAESERDPSAKRMCAGTSLFETVSVANSGMDEKVETHGYQNPMC